ncbi:hypothetical protein BJY16_008546 [Actinoplanes octamycinicus]|uniref:Uncharacterized protein n=1 Tax=Actinoplanes octamycinicus TaxID=135948 RepID=A0A7W7H7J5_9ACTN|nr:hypothetical protein [Actinoplanes octamycinicus]MBB4745087.1 hypothetical protein [Actinoplanes octamycinicus]GIE55673.1 hypothetical protein Aoc01nite_10750 [Actinoplanes octamycinicus]
MKHDRYELLTALRPAEASLDRQWPEADRDVCLARVLATEPDAPPARRRLRRRAVIVSLAGLGIFAAGIGVAGAAGRLPESFTRAFGSWQRDVGVDPQRLERRAGVPGPDGTVFTVWVATGDNGITCVATAFETPGQPQRSDPNGATCAPSGRSAAFGDGLAINGDARAHTFDTTAGDNVRAEVHLGDRTVLPTILVEGRFFGWYPSTRVGAPELVAYDAAGRVSRLPLKYLGS